MTTETSITDNVLTVRRTFSAPLEEVFEAWMQAGKTRHWWGCKDTVAVQSDIAPEVGGHYRHTMTIDGVGDVTIEGTITDYAPPHRLAYRFPGMTPDVVMHVSVAFTTVEGGTLVVLTQSEIPSELTDIVAAGWTAAFDRQADFFAGARRAA